MRQRLQLAGAQIRYGWMSYPLRLRRLVDCLLHPLLRTYATSLALVDYISHLFLLLADLALLGEVITALQVLLKPSCRGLKEGEVEVLARIYGREEAYDDVVIDDRARIMTRRYALAYVSWHLINYWEAISPAVLVHEYLHIKQYRKMGSAYIYEALKAQRSPAGYNYGGPSGLQRSMMVGGTSADLNLEQQAEVMEDAYRHLDKGSLPVAYLYYVEQIKGHYA